MNRRPAWLRALVTLWGIWFATALTEPAGFLACPMHSASGSAVAGVDGAPAPYSHGHHAASPAATAGSHAGHHAATEHAPAPGESHHCTCLGHCCDVSAHALTTRVARWVPTPPAREVRAPLPPYTAYLATPVAHLRPFANGPPLDIA